MKPAPQLDRAAQQMRARNEISPAAKSAREKEEAFRFGYTAGTTGASRENCPLHNPILRRQWRAGFDLGHSKGLKITLPRLKKVPSNRPKSRKGY